MDEFDEEVEDNVVPENKVKESSTKLETASAHVRPIYQGIKSADITDQ